MKKLFACSHTVLDQTNVKYAASYTGAMYKQGLWGIIQGSHTGPWTFNGRNFTHVLGCKVLQELALYLIKMSLALLPDSPIDGNQHWSR